jgi:hypothetical protein
MLREIHERICDSHSGGRMLVHKAVREGYYWPKMSKDSSEVVKHCNKCQRFNKVMTNPPKELSQVLAPWPFAQ